MRSSNNQGFVSTSEKEALVIVYSIQHFQPYLCGRHLTLVTDHKLLIWFQNSENPCSRVTRWRFKFAKYDSDVVYKAGKTKVNADKLSRNAVESIKEDKNKKYIPKSENKEDSKHPLNVIKKKNIEENFK